MNKAQIQELMGIANKAYNSRKLEIKCAYLSAFVIILSEYLQENLTDKE